jgi:hypothetical protein
LKFGNIESINVCAFRPPIVNVVIRTTGDPALLSPTLRHLVAEIDPTVFDEMKGHMRRVAYALISEVPGYAQSVVSEGQSTAVPPRIASHNYWRRCQSSLGR